MLQMCTRTCLRCPQLQWWKQTNYLYMWAKGHSSEGWPVTPLPDMPLHFGPHILLVWVPLHSSVFSDYLLVPVHSSVLPTRLISWSFSLTRLLTSSWKSFQPLVSRLLHCSCLENSMDRRAWQATVHGLQGVGRDSATNTHTCARAHTHTHTHTSFPGFSTQNKP